jgi:hypothetical protein
MKLETALKLEKVVEKLITSRLQSLDVPENFDSVKADIYPGDYGIYCHISFLMKQPFSREDSDFFNDLEFKSYIKSAFGDVFTRGIGDSQSTVKHYENTSKWYDIQKEGFE